jgi:hypothetical protein
VALADPGHGGLDLLALGHVAELVLAAELVGQRLEPLAPAGDEDAAPAALREPARDRLADARAGSGDYGDALNTRIVSTLIATVSSIGSA